MGITNSCGVEKKDLEHEKTQEISREMLNKEFEQILINNKKWVAKMNQEKPTLFKELSKEQKPELLWIGCSDSRVPPSQILALLPGKIFEHRNIANTIISTDFNSQSVINYAVEHLHVKHIIVCGHYNCGGIAGALAGKNLDFLNNWLVHLNDVHRLHQKEIDEEKDEVKKLHKFVEFNAIENAINVMKNISVQKQYAKNGYPTVHATVYNIETGKLKELNVDLVGKMKEFGSIYGHSINAYHEGSKENISDEVKV